MKRLTGIKNIMVAVFGKRGSFDYVDKNSEEYKKYGLPDKIQDFPGMVGYQETITYRGKTYWTENKLDII